MTVTKHVDAEKKVTTFKIVGNVSFDEFRRLIYEYYQEDPTDFVIFDLREAGGQGEEFTHEKVYQLVNFVDSVRRGREKGKTALVANRDVHYGICSMIEGYMIDRKIEYKTFRHMKEAVEWLEE